LVSEPRRCDWVPLGDALYLDYHDREWGVPVHDDRRLFEMLVLEGAQAGLSWRTVLTRRPAYREAFEGFDPAAVAAYGPERVDELLADARLIRNRRKLESAVANAGAVLRVQEQEGSLAAYLWSFVDGRPVQGGRRSVAEIPATSPASDAMSKDLKRRGFSFVGSTICYAMMQAVGMVNDHVVSCFRHAELTALAGQVGTSPSRTAGSSRRSGSSAAR
jgi:DNA-3-methyladenine glycosylase I